MVQRSEMPRSLWESRLSRGPSAACRSDDVRPIDDPRDAGQIDHGSLGELLLVETVHPAIQSKHAILESTADAADDRIGGFDANVTSQLPGCCQYRRDSWIVPAFSKPDSFPPRHVGTTFTEHSGRGEQRSCQSPKPARLPRFGGQLGPMLSRPSTAALQFFQSFNRRSSGPSASRRPCPALR